MPEVNAFAFESKARGVQTRFDDFIAWAEPGGTGGFNRVHVKEYGREDPFFTYDASLLPHSHCSNRSWFVKQEYLKQAASGGLFSRAQGNAVPRIKNSLAMIGPGRFLAFAKAYLNVYCEIRRVRSSPRSTVRALIFLEKAVRDLHDGDNDPSHISHLAFQRAALAVLQSGMSPGPSFDTGKALEHLSLLVQVGGRFKGDKKHTTFPGFKLIDASFAFRSPINSPPKFGKKRETGDARSTDGHLTSEEVAALGLAYRRAVERFGADGVPTFYSALMGLTMTTASMRASELQSLREDALYLQDGRHRLRVPRPKIGIEQDVPVSRRLGPLAAEIFEVVRRHSAEARAAFAFYIKQSPDSLDGVHTLYVPNRVRGLLKFAYLSKARAHAIINPDVTWKSHFPQRLSGVGPLTHFVEKPGDIYGMPGKRSMVKIRDVTSELRTLKIKFSVPSDAQASQYISIGTARKWLDVGQKTTTVLQALRSLFCSCKARKCETYMSRDAVVAFLLSEFKRSDFPHWPFTSKDRSVRLDKALAVHFESGQNHCKARGTQRQEWWLPRLLSIQVLNRWVSARDT